MYEYGNILDLICSTTIALPGKKKTYITVGSLRIREFRAQYVDLLVNTLRERKGIKGPTMSNTRLNDILLRVVRPLLDLAHQREYLDKNPHEWVQKRRTEHPDDIDPFSFDEMMVLMAALPNAKWVRYYTVAFGTGLRPSEQNALQWAHIDFAGKTILVRQGVVRGRQTLLKTKGSRRDVDMLPMVEEALRSQYAARSGQYVFSNARGGPLFQEGMRRRVWDPTLKRAGLRHRNAYQTRHTFATLMLSQGEEIAWVARMMGHTTTRMIVEHYYKFIPHRTRQDGDRFTKAFQDAIARGPSLDHP